MNASSDKPWVKYNALSGALLEVSAVGSPELSDDERWIAINPETAVDFLTGKLRLRDYVAVDDSKIVPRTNMNDNRVGMFWELRDAEDSIGLFRIKDKLMSEFYIKRMYSGDDDSLTIYLTRKHDPNALLNTIVVDSLTDWQRVDTALDQDYSIYVRAYAA